MWKFKLSEQKKKEEEIVWTILWKVEIRNYDNKLKEGSFKLINIKYKRRDIK